MEYNHLKIELKWQRYWQENKTFKTKKDLSKKKCYVLDMFPYPSGAGLHVGHPLGYTATDIYSRFKRLQGFNVLHPMGWDAFGLPAEQYAIKTGTHPKITTEVNIKNFKRQIQMLGFSYDWDREINTTDEKYYKWTQWIFLQLYKKEVVVKKLIKKKFEKKLKFSGFTEASRIVILKSQVEGKISSKFFEKGKSYKAGTQLILIDPEDKIAKLKEMEALLNQRKKEYEVAENLFNKGFRSEVKLSESRTNFEKALALYEKSQVNLNNTKIYIPFDSIVEDSYVELGDYLKKGDPIAKVVDLDPIFITINITEKEISKIKKGQVASVKISDNFYKGKVNYVSRTSDKLTRNFKVQIELSNLNNNIISGLSSEIQIGTKSDSAYFISSSLISLDSQGILGIKVILNNKVSFLPIEVLSDVGNGYWIKLKKPITDDILIITQGNEYVIDGDLISFKFEENVQ